MIINIQGEKDYSNSKGVKIRFDIPVIVLDRKYNYKIGVKFVHLETSPIMEWNLEDKALIAINTNLIDRSSINPTQTIYFFWNESNNSTIQRSLAPSVAFYPLQLYEVGSATFEIISFLDNRPLHLKKAFIQLEITRIDSHGRIQQIN